MWPLITPAAAASYKQEVLKATTDWMAHPPFQTLSGFHKVELRMAKGRERDCFFSNQIKSLPLQRYSARDVLPAVPEEMHERWSLSFQEWHKLVAAQWHSWP